MLDMKPVFLALAVAHNRDKGASAVARPVFHPRRRRFSPSRTHRRTVTRGRHSSQRRFRDIVRLDPIGSIFRAAISRAESVSSEDRQRVVQRVCIFVSSLRANEIIRRVVKWTVAEDCRG